MRILWYNWKCWCNPEKGGAEVFTHEVAKRLANNGHEITLFTSEFKGSRKQEYLDNVKIVRDGGKYLVYLRAKSFYQKNSDQFDIVIDEINTRPFMTPNYVKKDKIVVLIHQLAREFWFYETKFPVNYLGYHFLEKSWLRQYINIPTLTVSESTKNDLLEWGFNDVHILPEGLSVKPLNNSSDKNVNPTMIFIGRLKRVKNPDHAVAVFRIIKKILPKSELWIVGDGYFANRFRKMSLPGMTFYGRVSEKEKYKLLQRSHILLVPGIREGWGLVVLEANAMGTPAIAYNVHGLRDAIIDTETGFLVPYGEIEKMATKVVDLLNNYDVMATRAIKWSKRFDWDKSASKMSEQLQNVIANQFSKTKQRDHQ